MCAPPVCLHLLMSQPCCKDSADSISEHTSFLFKRYTSHMQRAHLQSASATAFCGSSLTLTVPVTTIDALQYFETG